jgi:hypothetical protein
VRHWLRGKWTIRVGVIGAILVILAIALVAPSPHDVHSPGATPLSVAVFDSDQTIGWGKGGPSQSLGDINCQLFVGQPNRCDSNALSNHFPQLTQHPHVLYVVWPHCRWSENGNYVKSQGFNLDFLPATRTLVIHCYAATPWLLIPTNSGGGTRPSPLRTLLAIQTTSIRAGDITIWEDDRLEHLLGDQSAEFQFATATIS